MAKKNPRKERMGEFLAEAEEIITSMGRDLLKLGKGVKAGIIDHSVLNGVFRSAHTLKGMSGIYELKDMAELSHSLEDTLDMLRLGRVELTSDLLASVMDAHALLTRILASGASGDFSGEVGEVAERLEAGRKSRKKDAGGTPLDKELLSVLTEYEEHRLRENLKQGSNVFVISVSFPVTSFDKGYARVTDLLKDHAELIATLPSNNTEPEVLHFDLLVGTDRDRATVAALLEETGPAKIRPISEPSARSSASGSLKATALEEMGLRAERTETLKRTSDTVRVDIAKLENIMHTVSELGIIKTTLTRMGAELRNEREFSAYGVELSRMEKLLERKLSELRDGVLDVRMVPIGHLFGRFDTTVERLAREAGKEVNMVTHGAETELDKLIVEELADPLLHIIRNVVDHALETPDEREAAGKTREGTLVLRAFQKANHVVVEVEDDGMGIDVEAVRAKALAMGIVDEARLGELSEQEALELIFRPGFSTREEVSATSGRGVGMDVVKENITGLSGIIDIETARGRGTRFILTIPITLAIMQALIVEASRFRYAVPLSSVIEIMELSPVAVATAESEQAVKTGERTVPAVRLSTFLGKEPDTRVDTFYGIMAGLAEHRVCIIVDRLVEELDVVIKPLPRILKVPGIAGAADMGEKGTVLVLDVTGILGQALEEKLPAARA